MQLLLSDDIDTTTLSYWLNWRALLCAVWVFTSMIIASYLIWKYESSDNLESHEGNSQVLRYDECWKPCLKEIHPVFLLLFRLTAFSLLLVALSFDLAIHGAELFYYYTQWTFTLVTIYFGLGSILSADGCFHYFKMNSSSMFRLSDDTEQGLRVPIAHEANGNGVKLLDQPGESHALLSSGFWRYLFQILYQMTAGAVTLTDVIYWCLIFPFLTLRDYEMSFLTVTTHSLNAILIFGEAALNSLQFPWFRISYFILWTGIYVIFQWIVHATVTMWWPYPILDLSRDLAPLWYLVVALLHLPCYGIFFLFVSAKHFLLARRYPGS